MFVSIKTLEIGMQNWIGSKRIQESLKYKMKYKKWYIGFVFIYKLVLTIPTFNIPNTGKI